MARRDLPSPKCSIGDSSGGIILRRPTVSQRTPETFTNDKRVLSPSQSPQRNNPWNKNATIPPTIDTDRGNFSTPKRTPEQGRPFQVLLPPAQIPELIGPSNPPTFDLDLRSEQISFPSQLTALMKQVAPFTVITLLTLSAIMSCGVLSAGIDQAVSGSYSDGIPALVIALVFVVAWLIASIFFLIMMLKRAIRRRHKGVADKIAQPT
jgi:hypothetical protein